jgi:hypothetical protein
VEHSTLDIWLVLLFYSEVMTNEKERRGNERKNKGGKNNEETEMDTKKTKTKEEILFKIKQNFYNIRGMGEYLRTFDDLTREEVREIGELFELTCKKIGGLLRELEGKN